MNRFSMKPLVVAAIAGSGMLAGAAQAATDTQNVQVTATVNSNCRITGSSSPVAFGVVDVNPAVATDLAQAGQVTLNCNKGAVVAVTVDNGLHGTWNMLNGSNTDTLAYTLKMPAGGSPAGFTNCPAAGSGTNWTSLNLAPAYTASGGPQAISICGQLHTPQLGASPGSYTDTVVVTATF